MSDLSRTCWAVPYTTAVHILTNLLIILTSIMDITLTLAAGMLTKKPINKKK
jgi:hypothetical protein